MSFFPDIDLTPLGADAEGNVSPDRRRTIIRNQRLAAGQHPTGLGRVDTAHKCGDCRFRFANGGHARTYWKCLWLGPTHGPATDIRLGWPSCAHFFEEGVVMSWAEAKEWSAHRPPVAHLVAERENRPKPEAKP